MLKLKKLIYKQIPENKIEAYAEAVLNIIFDKACCGAKKWDLSHDLKSIILSNGRKVSKHGVPNSLQAGSIGKQIRIIIDDEDLIISTQSPEELFRMIDYYQLQLSKESITALKDKSNLATKFHQLMEDRRKDVKKK